MDISIRGIGGFGGYAANIIEMTVTDFMGNSSITETITDLNSFVDESLIYDLRNIADELEEHNNKLKNN